MSMNPPRPRRYAEQTHVEAKQSRVEIEALLKRAGAIDITWPEEFEGKALVYFKPERRPIRIAVPLPRKPEPPAPVSRRSWAADYYQAVHRRYERAEKSYQQQVRQRWRGLLLLIKAKFEAIASGLEPVDVAFLPYLELPEAATSVSGSCPRSPTPCAKVACPTVSCSGRASLRVRGNRDDRDHLARHPRRG
jgi:hypothetical protein